MIVSSEKVFDFLQKYRVVRGLGIRLARRIPDFAKEAKDFTSWTRAVYEALKLEVKDGWKILPEDRCYAGEYLCDFILYEEGYGVRLACESQWKHWGRDHQAQLDWAFDKLRGVKADVKVFIFEGSEEEWQTVQHRYLKSYAQLSRRETFLALRWEHDHFTCYVWQPEKEGRQDRVNFEEYSPDPGVVHA